MTALLASPQGLLTAALLLLALYWLGLATLGAVADWRAHRARDAALRRRMARMRADAKAWTPCHDPRTP